MRKLFLFLFISQIALAQNSSQLWKGYFSYNDVKDLTESPAKITASTQKALFSKSFATNELKTITTVNGLSGQDISAIYYSPNFNKTIIGHANGLLLLLNESSGNIQIVPGIRDQAGISPSKKKINHFYEYQGRLYISCDFGVVQFNLETSLFGDTYLIGPAGEEVVVYQTAVLNNFIYAATNTAGIRRASLSNPNLNDFAQWQTFEPGNWPGIVVHNGVLIGLSANNAVYKFTGAAPSLLLNLPQPGADIRSYENTLSITTLNHVYSFNASLIQTAHVASTSIASITATFNCATVIGNNFYIGTKENGVITASISNLAAFEIIKPDGPSRNNIFAINASSDNLWAVYGGYDIFYIPNISSYGISKLSKTGWLNIPYEETLGANSISRITVNPNDQNNVFFSSFHSGILEFQNDVAVAKYDQNTADGPQSVFLPDFPNYRSVRINGAAFDKTGNYWFTNSLIGNAVKVLKADNSWASYSIGSFVSSTDQNYGPMAIDKNGTKWFASEENGLIGFNENVTPKFKLASSAEDEGNPLLANARSLAIDNNNRIWIGTLGGLRVLPSADRFLGEDPLETNPIIILEDGLAQELLYEQFITDIVVDGANNKWVGTGDSGVFLLSPNGQETLYRFTRENSPLPSNTINDIDINPKTGEVFFATDAGMVSFKGTSTGASDDLSNVYVYPNPVRPEFTGTVKISGLIDKANIKITDIEGNLVYETTSAGGTVEWDTKAFGKYRVASGVYMIFIASKDGTETKVKKVMVIR
ncbi:MAG TPA: T9SS type A sorting domain-containing protein [Flavobacterium sp.]|nr:T9SS type A sorting domain-containing protein [Flavobacterium sp.]